MDWAPRSQPPAAQHPPSPGPGLLLLPLAFAAGARAQQLQSTILPDAVEGQAYSFQITTQPPQGPATTYSSERPPGRAFGRFRTSGLISGTTNPVGTFNGNLSLTANSVVTLYPFQITVDPAPNTPVITSNGTISGTVGTALSYDIVASENPTSCQHRPAAPGAHLVRRHYQRHALDGLPLLHFGEREQFGGPGRDRRPHVHHKPRGAGARDHERPRSSRTPAAAAFTATMTFWPATTRPPSRRPTSRRA